ncbi:MAG TPA: chemotaxis protein CheB, partial [Chthoniobacterales bacterium]
MEPNENPSIFQSRDIVVIGGSAGSLEPLKNIVGGLPADFPGSIFVVIHVSANSPGLFDEYLAQCGSLPASHPRDQEAIHGGHIYLARPDYHLTLEPGTIRIRRGPRENRHRPAIDPLFRTAARVYGPRVIGIVLSGLRDDGSAGLYAIKQRGGVVIVQDPNDAPFEEMPRRALEYSSPHYILPASEIPPNLIKLAHADRNEPVMPNKNPHPGNSQKEFFKTSGSLSSDKPDQNLKTAYFDEGEGTPSVFACPECHGVLWELKDENFMRFRCRVGHSYGTDSLSQELSEASENALWAAMRALEEKAALQRRIADHLGGDNLTTGRLLDQSSADDASARLIR